MARDDRPPGPEDEARRMRLEGRARWLLRLYPAVYRQERGEEIIGTLLEATADNRKWPRARDVRAFAVGGLKARAAQNRQRTVSANLRVAVMAGLAMYLSYWLAAYVDVVVQPLAHNWVHVPASTNWNAVVVALLLGATVALAWTAPRIWVLAGALAAAVGVVSFALMISGPAALLGPRLLQVLALAALAALAPPAGHPSRHWLWLPGAIAVSVVLLELGIGYSWLGLGLLTPGLPLLAMIVGGILWVVVDARVIVAVLTYFVVTALQVPVAEISYGPGILATLPFLGVGVALAAAAVWVLRRQSARPAR